MGRRRHFFSEVHLTNRVPPAHRWPPDVFADALLHNSTFSLLSLHQIPHQSLAVADGVVVNSNVSSTPSSLTRCRSLRLLADLPTSTLSLLRIPQAPRYLRAFLYGAVINISTSSPSLSSISPRFRQTRNRDAGIAFPTSISSISSLRPQERCQPPRTGNRRSLRHGSFTNYITPSFEGLRLVVVFDP